MTKVLKKDGIEDLISSARERGGRFVAPKAVGRQVFYKEVAGSKELAFDCVLPENSFKEFLFPQTEVVSEFRIEKHGIELAPIEPHAVETVIFGVRPCEAAALGSLNSVFTWDYVDETFTKRKDNTVIISIACTKGRGECFCTTVGLSPDSKEGSDVMLRETEDGDYVAEPLTDRGGLFMVMNKTAFQDAKGNVRQKALFYPEVIAGIDLKKISERLRHKDHYNDPIWPELARKCIGCGACTYVCPTCHCFDLIDEGASYQGERRKNWDSCQFDQFTLHASGHNPRDAQFKRWRNRFMCKFNFYPEKFASKGCVGCGRCIRVCPVGLDITEVMEAISG